MTPLRLTVTMFLLFLVHLPMAPAAVAAEPLRFAYQNRIGDAVSIIAVNRDFFAEEGLQVKGLLFNNGAACAEAIFTGAVDVATMGDTAALLAVSREPTLRIIASHGAGEKRHRIIVPQASPIRSLNDLKGKRIGVKKGTSTHGGFLALLAAKGINSLELRIIDLDPAIMPDALAAGSLDAFVASEPTPSLAEQKGGRELADLGADVIRDIDQVPLDGARARSAVVHRDDPRRDHQPRGYSQSRCSASARQSMVTTPPR